MSKNSPTITVDVEESYADSEMLNSNPDSDLIPSNKSIEELEIMCNNRAMEETERQNVAFVVRKSIPIINNAHKDFFLPMS